MQVLHIPAYYDEDQATDLVPVPVHPIAFDAVSHEAISEQATAPADEVLEIEIEKEQSEDGSPAEELEPAAETTPSKRLGIHYFPNPDHYSQEDMKRWLPAIQSLGVNWVVLRAPLDRAIPQDFIESLIASDIQPIVHFDIPLTSQLNVDDYAAIFSAYANWGVRYVVLFDRPNLRANWPGMAWTQRNLVQRFLAVFAPLANAVRAAGLTPVFPALEPGGDYWDTAFLRSALEGLAEQNETALLETLALGAYAWTGDRPMTWGAGGPESWPATLPYYTPDGSQDQRGFRIFDWYNAITRSVLSKELPIILVGAGAHRESGLKLDADSAKRAIKIAESLQRKPDPDANNTVPANVVACNYWLLAAEAETPEADLSWFEPNGKPSKTGREWLEWHVGDSDSKTTPAVAAIELVSSNSHAISHYLLLPDSTDWPMDAIRTFLQANHATMGTSSADATKAARVTLAGGMDSFPDELIRSLIAAGCAIDHLDLQTS